MITKAFLQESGSRKLSPETKSLVAGLKTRGVPVELFTEKKLFRRQLPLSPETLVAGSIPVVLQALAQLTIPQPEPNDYPSCLEPYLHRRVWQSTVAAVYEGLMDGTAGLLFIKPKGRLKRFTGRVFSTREDIYWLSGTSKKTPVYCSEVVTWRSEYRAYVVRGRVVGVHWYWGDASVLPDEAVIRRAVQVLEGSGQAPSGYGIDFGVLANGKTALIELNDGFGLGSYGLDDALYTDLIMARWCQLMSSPRP